MSKKLTLPDTEIEIIRQKIKRAREDAAKQAEIRKKATDAYYRLPLGNEKEGRSKYIDTAVSNNIGGLHPHLMRAYLASDLKVRIIGPDEKIAKALKQRIRDDISEQGGFLMINDVLLDGEICHNGTTKMWWSRTWGEPIERNVVVTQEQLQQLVEDPRFVFDESNITALPPREAEINDGIPTPTSPMGTIIHVQGAPMFSVDVTFRDLTESGPVIASMPPEEVLFERGKARMNDRYGCGHVRKILAGELQRENERKSTVDEPYYTKLKEAVDAGGSTTRIGTEEDERRAREELGWIDSMPVTGESLRKECEVIEWCDWAEEDGELEPAFFVFVNDVCVRVEENEDGIIPFSTWTPYPTPHSVVGQSVAIQHVDRQNVRTQITRTMLDQLAMSVDKPRWVKNRGTDMLGLQNITPGKMLFGNPEDVQFIEPTQINHLMLTTLEYLKAEGEESGPTTRMNQGVNPQDGNDTATGMQIVQRASFNKIDLISMNFAEMWAVDVYSKGITLYQKNLDMPVTVKVDGEEVTLTKKNIQGRYVAKSDLGAVVDFDDRAFQQSNATLSMMTSLLKQGVYPFAPEAMKAAVKDVLTSGGKADPSKYLEVVNMQQAAPPPPGGPPKQLGPGGPAAAAPESDATLAGGAKDPGAGMAAGE